MAHAPLHRSIVVFALQFARCCAVDTDHWQHHHENPLKDGHERHAGGGNQGLLQPIPKDPQAREEYFKTHGRINSIIPQHLKTSTAFQESYAWRCESLAIQGYATAPRLMLEYFTAFMEEPASHAKRDSHDETPLLDVKTTHYDLDRIEMEVLKHYGDWPDATRPFKGNLKELIFSQEDDLNPMYRSHIDGLCYLPKHLHPTGDTKIPIWLIDPVMPRDNGEEIDVIVKRVQEIRKEDPTLPAIFEDSSHDGLGAAQFKARMPDMHVISDSTRIEMAHGNAKAYGVEVQLGTFKGDEPAPFHRNEWDMFHFKKDKSLYLKWASEMAALGKSGWLWIGGKVSDREHASEAFKKMGWIVQNLTTVLEITPPRVHSEEL